MRVREKIYRCHLFTARDSQGAARHRTTFPVSRAIRPLLFAKLPLDHLTKKGLPMSLQNPIKNLLNVVTPRAWHEHFGIFWWAPPTKTSQNVLWSPMKMVYFIRTEYAVLAELARHPHATVRQDEPIPLAWAGRAKCRGQSAAGSKPVGHGVYLPVKTGHQSDQPGPMDENPVFLAHT